MIFLTVLCDLLGVEYPIVQSGMGNVAGPELVAEVSRAGGRRSIGRRARPDRRRVRRNPGGAGLVDWPRRAREAMVARCHDPGIKVMAMVATVDDAQGGEVQKKALLESEGDTTTITDSVTGLWAR